MLSATCLIFMRTRRVTRPFAAPEMSPNAVPKSTFPLKQTRSPYIIPREAAPLLIAFAKVYPGARVQLAVGIAPRVRLSLPSSQFGEYEIATSKRA